MQPTRILLAMATLITPLSAVVAQPAKSKSAAPASSALPAAYSAIKEADLKHDLYEMAGLAMRGREAGTLDEMRASMWVADELRKIGVKPAGTDGSFFQWWNMQRTRVSTVSSSAKVGARTLALWTEIIPNGNAQVDVAGQTVWGGDGSDSTIDVRGKVVIGVLAKPANQVRAEGTNSFEYRYATSAIQFTSNRFQRRGAVAIILATDSIADIAFDGVASIRSRGVYDVAGGIPRNAVPAGGAAGGPGGIAGGGGRDALRR